MKYIKNLKSLRSLLLSICLVVFVLTLTGCGGTMTETSAERSRRYRHISRNSLGMIVDDWDAFWLMDKTSKLNKHIVRD